MRQLPDMARPCCVHGVPTIYDCPECGEDMRVDEYLASAYDFTPRGAPQEWWERAGLTRLADAVRL